MKISKNEIFINETTTKESESIANMQANTAVFQISGTATDFDISLLVSVDGINYAETTVVNLKSLDVGNNINEKGISVADITGIQKFKLKINSISGGYISVISCLESV